MEITLAKKITTNFFLYFGIFYFYYFILIVAFFSHVTLFSIPKKLLHNVKNHVNWLKNKKVIQSQKMS